LTANKASSKRLETPNLSKTLLKWCFTVFTLILNPFAMSLLDHPETAAEAICDSRGVRPNSCRHCFPPKDCKSARECCTRLDLNLRSALSCSDWLKGLEQSGHLRVFFIAIWDGAAGVFEALRSVGESHHLQHIVAKVAIWHNGLLVISQGYFYPCKGGTTVPFTRRSRVFLRPTPKSGRLASVCGCRFGKALIRTLARASVLLLCATASAGTGRVLYSFTGGRDGGAPSSALISDRAGNLYGTTNLGGAYGSGTAFKLTFSDGHWRETVIHSFGKGTDGALPQTSLTFDEAGNLYGTTAQGGASGNCNPSGCGIVFELLPTKHGWHEIVLHNFTSARDGSAPVAGMVFDRAGNLYGTTTLGGHFDQLGCFNGCGTIFKLTHREGLAPYGDPRVSE
jgi:hypothetical protein